MIATSSEVFFDCSSYDPNYMDPANGFYASSYDYNDALNSALGQCQASYQDCETTCETIYQ